MTNQTILQTTHLKKHYGRVAAVEDISLDIYRGEVYGFLGPNGAGKTTTIGMLLGLIYPTAGTIHLFGQPVTPSHTAMLRRVGSLVGATPALVPYLTARQNLALTTKLYPNISASRVDELLELVGLTEAANRKAGHFSTGMKQRLALANALYHSPDLLILDEPTNGMDPAGMREVRHLLRSLADQGMTIFISSHLLHEIQQICDRVAVLNRGHVMAQGTVAELMGDHRHAVRVRVASPADAVRVLQSLPSVQGIESKGTHVTVKGPTAEEVVVHLVTQGVVPSELLTVNADLESLFLELTQEAL